MATTNPPQLFLLADHIKLSLLERQRAVSLNLSPNAQDGQISRSLEQLRSGIESLESHVQDVPDESISSQLPRLHAQLSDLTAQFAPSTASDSADSHALTPNDPSLAADFAAAKTTPSAPSQKSSKSVRFRDQDDNNDDDDDDPNRASLFPYRDDPSDSPDHSELSNQQIHDYHSRIIDEQDSQLDALGSSISRQRELSMAIGDELDGQVVLLDDVEEGVDRHAAQFRRARGRLDRFSRKARENWSLSVIVCLIIILVLLIVITK